MPTVFPCPVLVRAYGDKPVMLTAFGVSPPRVKREGPRLRVSAGSGGWFNWHPADAFTPDDELFAQLVKAFDAEDKTTLTKLWGRAVPFPI